MSTPPPSTSAARTAPRQDVSSTSHPLRETDSQASTPASGQREAPLRSLDLSHLLAQNAAQRDRDAAAAAAQPPVAPPAAAAARGEEAEEGNQALRVRGNLLRSTYDGFKELGRARRWILVLRALIAVAQIVLGIVIMALPSSLGDSLAQREVCDPEGMFTFLALHTCRVICSAPLDVYLGLSPHRTPAARRNRTPAARDAREATRRVGNLALDARVSRISDILGLVHVALFVVGNWTVWNSLECAKPPADSVPLWWSCLALLVITYFVIAEVIILVCLVVFFLPLLLVILRALGLANRLPQPAIHPSTDKIGKTAIEQHTKLVYFTPAERSPARSSAEQLRSAEAATQPAHEPEEVQQAATAVPLPLSRASTAVPSHAVATAATPARRRRGGLARLFGRRKVAEASANGENKEHAKEAKNQAKIGELFYPLHPIPAHRATCPICLMDYEEPRSLTAGAAPASPSTAEAVEEEANEVLRLLRCGHVLHRSCVDEWMENVSGRCPVCSKSCVPDAAGDAGQTGDAAV